MAKKKKAVTRYTHIGVKKRHAAKKRFAKKSIKKKGARKKGGRVPGYKRRGSGLYVPTSGDFVDGEGVVKPSRMEKGIAEAKQRMKGMIYDFADSLDDGFEIAQAEFSASFSADGKFMGFGVGGATSIKLTIKIVEDDD
jgi:hypothetical protein